MRASTIEMLFRYIGLHSGLAVVMFVLVAAILPSAEPWRLALVAIFASSATALATIIVRKRNARALGQIAGQVGRWAEGEFASRIYVNGGLEVRALAQAVNATSERLAERFAHLEEDRGRLRTVLSGMVEGVVALDSSDRIVFANERAGLLLEFSPERAVGLKIWEVARQRAVQQVVQDAVVERRPCRLELDWPSKPPRSLAVYAAPLPGGPAAGLIVVIHDLSEIRRLERLRQEFVANVSHELKTPLSVIKACAETLSDGADADAGHRAMFLEQIDEQTDRLHALILDLLSIAKLESGSIDFDLKTVPLLKAVRHSLKRHQALAEAKGQSLTFEAPADPNVAAWADEESVDTILDNLVDNAIKYTPDSGTITVRCGIDGNNVWLEISDNGIGIPVPDLPRIFERFYRVDKARSRELGGTGLGLAIVKHLAQNMNGSVTASSEVGRGSSFTVRLPAGPVG